MSVNAVMAADSAKSSGRYDSQELDGGRAYEESPAEKTIENDDSRRE